MYRAERQDWEDGGTELFLSGEEDPAQSSCPSSCEELREEEDEEEYDGRKRRMELPCPGDRTRPDVALLLH